MASDQQEEAIEPAVRMSDSEEGQNSLPFSADQVLREIKRSRRGRVVRVVVIAVVLLVVVALVALAVTLGAFGSPYVVKDNSMAPALEQGQVVMVADGQTASDDDIIVCRTLSGEDQVRRVIASPGEWVNVASDGTYVVSSVPLTSDTMSQFASPEATLVDAQQLPLGVYFVLAESREATSEALGEIDNLVTVEQIDGAVTMRVWPPLPISARS